MPTRRQVGAPADRKASAGRERHPDAEPVPPPPDPAVDRRIQALDARVAYLEAALEDLQDALYRQSIREDDTRAELHERTEPNRIARELSADARRRGL